MEERRMLHVFVSIGQRAILATAYGARNLSAKAVHALAPSLQLRLVTLHLRSTTRESSLG